MIFIIYFIIFNFVNLKTLQALNSSSLNMNFGKTFLIAQLHGTKILLKSQKFEMSAIRQSVSQRSFDYNIFSIIQLRTY